MREQRAFMVLMAWFVLDASKMYFQINKIFIRIAKLKSTLDVKTSLNLRVIFLM